MQPDRDLLGPIDTTLQDNSALNSDSIADINLDPIDESVSVNFPSTDDDPIDTVVTDDNVDDVKFHAPVQVDLSPPNVASASPASISLPDDEDELFVDSHEQLPPSLLNLPDSEFNFDIDVDDISDTETILSSHAAPKSNSLTTAPSPSVIRFSKVQR
ncbi:hypothetical protein EDC96DRAFT_547129, partial [Choanephora cucurbitarum]